MPAAKESSQVAPGVDGSAKGRNHDIIDIRNARAEINLKDEIQTMFNPVDDNGKALANRSLPTLLLYDEKGLQLFEDITYLDEYYLTNKEIELLKKYSADIAHKVPSGAMVIELGSGNLRKVCLLLQEFEKAAKPIDYYALDLSETELERTLAQVPPFKYVRCHGLLGTYDDGKEWLGQTVSVRDRPKCILHLGSSLGNFRVDEAVDFLAGFAGSLGDRDSMVVGVDACDDPERVYHAYNDKQGVTHQFILNGLAHANAIHGKEIFHIPDWKAFGEYVYDEEGGRHQAFLTPIRETSALGAVIRPGERIKIEQSVKFSGGLYQRLWKAAGLHEVALWGKGDDYGLHMLRKTSNMAFNLNPSVYAAKPLPSVQDWEALWQVWDTVTRQMLPDQELNDKPIKLRNACIFYLGHIPTFLDIQLTKTTKEAPTDPASYYTIFERGIDPDVDNPEHCHDHSEIPDEWPPVEDILAYERRVRNRLLSLYKNGQENIPRHVGRAVWIGFEHEVMHLETLLYMMLQSDKTLPPPQVVRPDFEGLARDAMKKKVPNQWFDVPEQSIKIGMDDPEDSSDVNLTFGWDNEKPAREHKVHAFQAKGRPITNQEYAQYLYSTKSTTIPASWATNTADAPPSSSYTNGTTANNSSDSTSLPESFVHGKSVRTVYGLVPLKLALDWPIFASYDELAGCAAWMGGRIPTLEEARSIYEYVDSQAQKKDVTQSKLARKFPAVNGHLVNDGVEETPPSTTTGNPTSVDESSSNTSSELFIDLKGANVGFTNWHPVAVTPHGDKLAGQAGMGGVWEWTSTTLSRHDGFEPMSLYPGYTADFFDEKHNVVLGGSWATHPRVAGRKSFVNWYQRNYLYTWAGARLVRDV